MKLTQLALTLAMAGTVYGMENDVTLDMMEKGSSILPELVKAIKKGKGSKLSSLLVNRSGNVDIKNDLTTAMGFTQGELAAQQNAMAEKMFDQFWTRYKHVAVPGFLAALSLTNLITGAISYSQGDVTATTAPATAESLITGSFGVNMASSAASFIGFTAETIRQAKKGWTDHRQQKKVGQLQTSELLLQLMQENAELKGNGG